MKPLDSIEGAAGGGSYDAEHGAAVRIMAPGREPGEPGPDGEPASEEPAVGSEPPAPPAHRVSQVVPRGTAEDEEASDDVDAPRHSDVAPRPEVAEVAEAEAAAEAPEPAPPIDTPSVPPLDAPPAPRFAIRELRASLRDELGTTLLGPSFGTDEDDDEATMVDAAAALSEADRVLMANATPTMAETQLVGTPLPAPSQPVAGPPVAVQQSQPVAPTPAVFADGRHPFKQTMLLGLPRLEPSPPAAPGPVSSGPSASASRAIEPSTAQVAVSASFVRVVGPPTQPPPRRSRRAGGGSGDPTTNGLAPADGPEPDHEAFALSNPIGAEPGRRSSVPGAPPSSPAPMSSPPAALASSAAPASSPAANAAAPGSLSSLLLPQPAPRASRGELSSPAVAAAAVGSLSARSLSRRDLPRELPERSSYPPAQRISYPPAQRVSYPPGQRVSYPPPLRATIDPPAALSRTRPPVARGTIPPPFAELPATDPFEGFVAPAPSAAQRWLVVVVVALAVVGLCSLAAIAFGLLGKTGW